MWVWGKTGVSVVGAARLGEVWRLHVFEKGHVGIMLVVYHCSGTHIERMQVFQP